MSIKTLRQLQDENWNLRLENEKLRIASESSRAFSRALHGASVRMIKELGLTYPAERFAELLYEERYPEAELEPGATATSSVGDTMGGGDGDR